MHPGEYISPAETLELNAGRAVARVVVRNTGDRPIQVGSHYHFFEVNKALEFDRARPMACAWISRPVLRSVLSRARRRKFRWWHWRRAIRLWTQRSGEWTAQREWSGAGKMSTRFPAALTPIFTAHHRRPRSPGRYRADRRS
jgi:hypothetical protein